MKYCHCHNYSVEYEKKLFKTVDLIALTTGLLTFIVFNIVFWFYSKSSSNVDSSYTNPS